MDVNKERDLRFIKEFQKITLATICKDLNITKENIYRGNASAESIKRVRKEIEKRINDLPH